MGLGSNQKLDAKTKDGCHQPDLRAARDRPVRNQRGALARIVQGRRGQADRGVHGLEVDAVLQPRLHLQVLRRKEAVPDAGEGALQEAAQQYSKWCRGEVSLRGRRVDHCATLGQGAGGGLQGGGR